MSEIVTFFLTNWFIFFIVGVLLIVFRWWLSWVTKQRTLAVTKARDQLKHKKSTAQDEDLAAYIMNPEDSIELLKGKRKILEKENKTKQIPEIDEQIKWLEYACKIPKPFRSVAAEGGEAIMKKAVSFIKDF